MSPEEKQARLSANIKQSTKQTIIEESERLGLSQTEYIERLVEGTIPSRLEGRIDEKIEEIRTELKSLLGKLKK